MRRVDTASAERTATATRVAFWVCLAAAISLLLLLFATRPAAASTLLPGPVAGPAVSLPLDGEEVDEEEETEEEELEAEAGDVPPAACLLQKARAQVFAYSAQNKVRLLIRYTSAEPTGATVAYRLNGGKGSVRFAEAKEQLGKSGSIRLSENLSAGQTSKVSAANSFTVELRIPGTPRSCRRFDTRHLTIEHGGGKRLTWLQSESVFGT